MKVFHLMELYSAYPQITCLLGKRRKILQETKDYHSMKTAVKAADEVEIPQLWNLPGTEIEWTFFDSTFPSIKIENIKSRFFHW